MNHMECLEEELYRDDVTIKLSIGNIEYIIKELEYYNDRGPSGSGWQSDQLIDLIDTLKTKYKKVKQCT